MNEADRKRELENLINNYQQTVKALLAFSSFVVHDGTNQRLNSRFGIGRKMTTSDGNKIQKSSEITPDLVAQKSLNYGIIGEVKKSLPRKDEYWESCIEQIRKYDDELTGWWTDDERIASSNSLMLIHLSRSREFVDYFKSHLFSNPDIISNKTGIVEFSSSDENASFYFFRLEYGDIHDPELKERLYNGVMIPLDKVLRTFPTVNYYDSEPHPVLILTDLWTNVFPSKIQAIQQEEESKVFKIKVSVTEITNELQEAYGSRKLNPDHRSVEFPKFSWIKKALDELVRFKLAVPPANGNSEYEIQFRRIRKDIQDKFIDLYVGDHKKSKKADEKQRLLFGDVLIGDE